MIKQVRRAFKFNGEEFSIFTPFSTKVFIDKTPMYVMPGLTTIPTDYCDELNTYGDVFVFDTIQGMKHQGFMSEIRLGRQVRYLTTDFINNYPTALTNCQIAYPSNIYEQIGMYSGMTGSSLINLTSGIYFYRTMLNIKGLNVGDNITLILKDYPTLTDITTHQYVYNGVGPNQGHIQFQGCLLAQNIEQLRYYVAVVGTTLFGVYNESSIESYHLPIPDIKTFKDGVMLEQLG